MSRYKSLKTVCCAAVLTLGLAACGGGSDSDQAAAPDPTPPPTAAEQLMMAESAVAAAQAAVAAAMTPAEISAAYAQLASAQMLLSTAQSIPANQIAILAAQLEQLRMDLQNTAMLAEQRGSVGAALITAQNAVNGLSASSSDSDAMAAAALVAAAEAALASASALPTDDSLHGSVDAVVAQLAGVEMSRTVYSQQGTVDAAVAAADAAVDGLTNASTDDDVAAAYAAVMAAEAALEAATALPADDPRHALVTGVSDDFEDAATMRTASMETQAIDALISAAQTAVGGLNQVTSSGTDVAEARAAVEAVTAAIAGATALTEAEKATLSEMISASNTSLTGIEEFRATASGQLEVAQAAFTHAQGLVHALTPSSSAADAAAAYGALGAAQAAIHGATNLPANQIAALQKQVDDLTTEVGNADTASSQRTAVTDALVAANAAIGLLNDGSLEADVQAARALVTAAQNALTAATGLSQSEKDGLTALVDTADSEVDRLETVVAARPDPVVVAADTAAAKTKTTAIKAEADQETDASLGGGATPYMLSITRPRSGTVIKITDDDLAGEDDPKFVEAMDLGSGRTMHVRTKDANDDDEVVEEVVIVKTDIEPPKATAFAKVHTLDVSTNTENDGGAGTDDDTFEAILVDADDVMNARIKSAAFTAPAAAVLTFPREQEDNSGTADVDESMDAAEVAGTFDGAMGTYKCNAVSDDCTVELDAMGKIIEISADDWIFTPATGVTVDVADADHLHYGVWLKKTTDEDGVLTYDEVETFAMNSSVAASGSVTAVTGKAKYTGGATGVYVRNVHNSDSTIASATSGHFTADAELNAVFGQVLDENQVGTIAANLLNSLTGTIDNFELSGGEETAWSVSLEKAAVDDPQGTGNPNVTAGVAKGGGAEGSYTATFHGPVASVDHDDDDETENIIPQPSSVVGEFNAYFSNGSVAGGFGARK